MLTCSELCAYVIARGILVVVDHLMYSNVATTSYLWGFNTFGKLIIFLL